MRWAAVVITGIAGALIANGCIDDPTFIQAATDGGTLVDGTASSSSTSSSSTSSTGGSSTSSSSTSSSSGAPPTSACGQTCMAAGGTCEGSGPTAVCAFRCPAANQFTPLELACANQITCPAGVNCVVDCSAKNACKKITCNNPNNDCNIMCSGDTACSDQITSTAASTEINCTGNNACKKVDCEGSNCAVVCQGTACMAPDVKCCSKPSCMFNGAVTACKP